MDKDLRKILEEAERQGFTVTYSKKGHPMVWLDGRLVTTFSGTASDWRSLRNGLSYLKKVGFEYRRK